MVAPTIEASSPPPVGVFGFGRVVVVVPIGPAPGRQTSWYLSSSLPFVVEALAWIFSLPLSSSPFLSGPAIGTTKLTGAVHVLALDGNPIAATAASRALVSPCLILNLIFLIIAGLHFGSAGSVWFRQIVGVKRHDPFRMPSASHGSPSAQVVPLKTLLPPGKPIPLAMSWIRQSVFFGPPPATVTAPAPVATPRTTRTRTHRRMIRPVYLPPASCFANPAAA